MARIQLPRLDRVIIAEAAIEMTRNQMNEARKRPPGPTNWVKTPVARSSGRSGGKPPEITTVSERTMKSIPSVVMKLGMAKVSVMNPFTNPIAAAMTSPMTMARTSGTPAMIMSEVAIGASAKVEPTERSNSPQIIRIVTPTETRPTSGSSPRMPRRLSGDRKAPPDRASKTAVRMHEQRGAGELRLLEIDPKQVSQGRSVSERRRSAGRSARPAVLLADGV